MTIQQVKSFFQDKEQYPCPLTEMLVKSGYQQKSGGYIDNARKEGIFVDYTKNSPSQYWHLMSYCNSRDGAKPFNRTIVCGELIFWMAEVSNSVPHSKLESLVKRIIDSVLYIKRGRPYYDRIECNKEIQHLCFDGIEAMINKTHSK
jgi:hypothetical protein